jgi:cytochrome d ubiquinol oxidase subunit II
MSTTAAVILFAAITMYAIFGGADFGAGFWDLVAGGTKRGDRPREVIDHSIAPVWEANHVWLIFVFVLLWTCFPQAYASITLTLFVPLTVAAFGIVLRGASFAFRKAVFRTRDRRNFGAAFALSSVLVPYCLGAAVGSIASGRVPSGGAAGDPWSSWVNPTSVLGGVLAVSVTAYLAAFFLVWDARRLSDAAMVAYFRRRAYGAGVATGVVALVGIFVLSDDAAYLYDGLTSRALPLVVLSALAGIGALLLLARRSGSAARIAAVVAVASMVIAWGVGQWDYLLPKTLTVSAAAAPSGTIAAVLVATGLAVVLIVPAFGLLYVLDQRTLLPEEGLPDPPTDVAFTDR